MLRDLRDESDRYEVIPSWGGYLTVHEQRREPPAETVRVDGRGNPGAKRSQQSVIFAALDAEWRDTATLAEKCGLHRDTVRDALHRLIYLGQVERRSVAGVTYRGRHAEYRRKA